MAGSVAVLPAGRVAILPRVEALRIIDSWPVDHVAAAVVTRDGIVATRGETQRPFRLASVTKPLFAAAVLVASEEKTLSLDQPAGPPGSTVRHLLAHASGLPFEGRRPLCPPATKRVYSNSGFELLAEALEQASGLDAATYLHEAVCEPIGATTTHLTGSPAHGAVSCVSDLASFCLELLAPGRILAGATLLRATAVQFPGLRGIVPGYGMQEDNDWGLGFEIRDAKSPHWTGPRCSAATYGHFGQAGTFLWVDPVAGISLVCLADRDFDDWARRAWPALSDAVLAEMRDGGNTGRR